MIRVFWGLCWDSPILGNYQLGLLTPGKGMMREVQGSAFNNTKGKVQQRPQRQALRHDEPHTSPCSY